MRKIALAAAIAAASAVPAAALADVSYSYVGAGYMAFKPDGISRLDGFGIEGSVAVHDNVHLIANYLRAKDSPFTVNRTRVAAGYNMPLNSQVDVVGRLGWSFAKLSASNIGSAKDDGVFGQVGVRGMATDALELNGFLTYDDVEDKVSVDVGGVFNFTPAISASAGYTYSSNLQTWNIGLRYNF